MNSSPSSQPQRQLLEQLARQIRRIERSTTTRSPSPPTAITSGPIRRDQSGGDQSGGDQAGGPRVDSERVEYRTTGIAALDGLLADRGVPRGCLMEWLPAGRGGGVETLALWGAIRARRAGEFVVVIDVAGDFYMPGGARLGLDERTVVVRPPRPADALWTLEQALRTPGAGVVICPWERLRGTAFRRLQLAAEQGGCLGVLLRPGAARGEPSFAEVRWWVDPLPSPRSDVRRWRVELLRARRQMGARRPEEARRDAAGDEVGTTEVVEAGRAGLELELELHDDDGRLHLVAPLVPATARAEAAGA